MATKSTTAKKTTTKKTTAKSSATKTAAKSTAKKTTTRKKKITENDIRKKAQEIYDKRILKGTPGTAESDWLQAEKMLIK